MREVKVTAQEYERMQRRIAKLDALEAGGVDNWDWYDESLTEWHKDNDIDDLLDDACTDFDEVLVGAEVDQPAGRGCGYAVRVDSTDLTNFLRQFGEKYHEIKSRQ